MPLKPSIYIILIFALNACSNGYVQYCKGYPAQKSQVLSDNFRYSDSKDSCEIVLRIYTAPDSSDIEYASIEWKNRITNQTVHGSFIQSGAFSKSFLKGEYRLKIASLGYSDFEQDIILKEPGTRQIEILMGEAQKFVTYEVKRKDYLKMRKDSTTTH